MEQLTVEQLQHRRFKIKQFSRGAALLLVGAFIISFSGMWSVLVGAVLAMAGVGMLIQAYNLRV